MDREACHNFIVKPFPLLRTRTRGRVRAPAHTPSPAAAASSASALRLLHLESWRTQTLLSNSTESNELRQT